MKMYWFVNDVYYHFLENAVNFLCQACGTILGVHGKFQDFLNIFAIYLILFQKKCSINVFKS
jgi:hypothetical protein